MKAATAETSEEDSSAPPFGGIGCGNPHQNSVITIGATLSCSSKRNYIHLRSHFVCPKLSYTSIGGTSFRVLGGSRFGVSGFATPWRIPCQGLASHCL